MHVSVTFLKMPAYTLLLLIKKLPFNVHKELHHTQWNEATERRGLTFN